MHGAWRRPAAVHVALERLMLASDVRPVASALAALAWPGPLEKKEKDNGLEK